MRKFFTLILCFFVCSGILYAQSMTDEQVIQYVKQAQMAGKSQNQMAIELKTKGVTTQQVERIKKKIFISHIRVIPGAPAVGLGPAYQLQPFFV